MLLFSFSEGRRVKMTWTGGARLPIRCFAVYGGQLGHMSKQIGIRLFARVESVNWHNLVKLSLLFKVARQ